MDHCGVARIVVLLAIVTPAVGAPGAAQECGSLGAEAVRDINRARADVGLAPLSVDLRLVRAAAGHAAHLAKTGRVEHRGDGGSTPAERVGASGYVWSFVAENVAAGYASAAAVVQGWLESPSHRANMLSPEAHHVGIGYVQVPDGRYRHFWTAAFGATRDPRSPPPLECHP